MAPASDQWDSISHFYVPSSPTGSVTNDAVGESTPNARQQRWVNFHRITLKASHGGEPERQSNMATQKIAEDRNLRSPSLDGQLDRIPAEAKALIIEDDTPTDQEWTKLGAHFTSVEDLELYSGFQEYLNDRLIPSHWPLKRLLVSSACGEMVQSAHILLGRVRHVIFELCSGMLFEGPTPDALTQAHRAAIRRGEKEEHHVTPQGGTITYEALLVQDWMKMKYGGTDLSGPSPIYTVNPDLHVDTTLDVPTGRIEPGLIPLTVLEFIENDVIETFIRFCIALPHLAYNVKTLVLNSTNMCDLQWDTGALFAPMLSCLDQLDTFVLSIGEVFHNEDPEQPELDKLHRSFPENIRTLRFRGPISLTRSAGWEDWVVAFGDSSFLPQLEKLSFICDLAYDATPGGALRKKRRLASEDELVKAKAECTRLIDAVANRAGSAQVKIEPFIEPRAGVHSTHARIDDRWYSESDGEQRQTTETSDA